MKRTFAFIAILVVAGCGQNNSPPQKEERQSGVSLRAEEAEHLGIETVGANAVTYRREITGYGTVTSLDTIAQSDAELASSTAAAAQSSAAAARAKSLATGEEAAVSREILEATISKATTDQAAQALARRKVDAAYGLRAPWRDHAAREALMAKLASGQAVLVRVTFPLGSLPSPTPVQFTFSRLGDLAHRWISNEVWQAPADPAMPGRSFYALVGGSDLAQNEHVAVAIAVGSPEQGVYIPAAAVLIGESQHVVYIETAKNHFERRAIPADQQLGDGYFAPRGVRPGEKVVTSGAGLLLSREINPSSSGGGDD